MVLFDQRMIFLTFFHYFIYVECILIVSFEQKNKSYISNRSQQKAIITKNNKFQKVKIRPFRWIAINIRHLRKLYHFIFLEIKITKNSMENNGKNLIPIIKYLRTQNTSGRYLSPTSSIKLWRNQGLNTKTSSIYVRQYYDSGLFFLCFAQPARIKEHAQHHSITWRVPI